MNIFFREDSGGLTEPARKHWVITWCAQFTLSLAKGNKYIGWEGVWWQTSKIGMSCEIRNIFFSSSKTIFFGPWFAPKLRPSVEHEFSSHKVKGHLQHPNCWFPQLVAVPQLKKFSQRKRFWKFSICEDTSVQAEGATCSVFSRDAWIATHTRQDPYQNFQRLIWIHRIHGFSSSNWKSSNGVTSQQLGPS